MKPVVVLLGLIGIISALACGHVASGYGDKLLERTDKNEKANFERYRVSKQFALLLKYDNPELVKLQMSGCLYLVLGMVICSIVFLSYILIMD